MSFSGHFDKSGHVKLQYGGADERGTNTVLSDGGDTEKKPKMIFVPRERSRLNCAGVLASMFYPPALFTSLFWVMTFQWHYTNPNLVWFLVFISFGIAAYTAFKAQAAKDDDDAPPAWYTYNAWAFLAATILAAVCGNFVFFAEINTFYDYQTLNSYSAINPAHETGQMVMDSGRIYFAADVHLDIKKTAGFKHGDVYCVVPITHWDAHKLADDKLPTYDFWAVGVNCCEGPRKFHCGQDSNNWRARSALSNLDEDLRPFFRLAVQQAEAAYGIKADHPVFFNWSQDPLKEIHMYQHRAIRYFFVGSFVFFIVNFVMVMSSVFAFAKLGRAI